MSMHQTSSELYARSSAALAHARNLYLQAAKATGHYATIQLKVQASEWDAEAKRLARLADEAKNAEALA